MLVLATFPYPSLHRLFLASCWQTYTSPRIAIRPISPSPVQCKITKNRLQRATRLPCKECLAEIELRLNPELVLQHPFRRKRTSLDYLFQSNPNDDLAKRFLIGFIKVWPAFFWAEKFWKKDSADAFLAAAIFVVPHYMKELFFI